MRTWQEIEARALADYANLRETKANKDLTELVESIMTKTVQPSDRLNTALILLESKFSELLKIKKNLEDVTKDLEKRKARELIKK